MPANTPRGLPYPLPTEPVAEGAQAIRNLAEAVAPASPIVTVLPASPFDGQVVLYRAAAPAAQAVCSTVWAFRYSAAAPGALKWDFIGGRPLAIEEWAGSGVNNQTYQYVGPQVTLGLTGDYQIAVWGAANPDPGWNAFLAPGFSGLPANDNYAVVCSTDAAFNPHINVARGPMYPANLASGTTVALYARSTGGAWRWYARGFSIVPLRVTAAASRPAPDAPDAPDAPGPPPPMPDE